MRETTFQWFLATAGDFTDLKRAVFQTSKSICEEKVKTFLKWMKRAGLSCPGEKPERKAGQFQGYCQEQSYLKVCMDLQHLI